MSKSRVSGALATGIIIASLASGCGYSYKYPYSYNVEKLDKHVAITTDASDASKRSVLLSKERGGRSCSEPAPDAIGTIATSLAAKLSAQAEQPQSGTEVSVDGSVDTTTRTAITQLFQRSQGVQVLRDGMYRLCEAHLNGALDAPTYRLSVLSLISTLNYVVYVVPMELCTRLTSTGGANQNVSEVFNNCVKASYDFATALNDQTTSAISAIMKAENTKAASFEAFLKQSSQSKEPPTAPKGQPAP